MNKIILKEQRHEKILSSLDVLGFATTEQIRQVHSLGSTRNTNRILHDLSEYLNSFRDRENVYYLNKKGAERIGSATVRDKKMQFRHFLMRNDLYIHVGCPNSWETESPIQGGMIRIIPDALFERQGKYAIVEVDHTQKMIVNEKKLNKYQKLKGSNSFQKELGYFPTLIWVTTTEVRRKKLTKYCEERGLPHSIYTESDFH